MSKGSQPVFIVGMNGSGTNMMLDHLGEHPEMFAFPLETYILPRFLLAEDEYGCLSDDSAFQRLWNDIASTYPFRFRNRGVTLALPEDWQAMPRSVAGVFDRIMREFASRDGKSRWAEKTPMHVLHISALAAAFPDARFLHMIRDGRDCAASDHRRWGRHPASTVHRWKAAIDEGRRQGAEIKGRYLEMRYEQVTREPEKYMAIACEFVGLEFDCAVLGSDRARMKAPASARGIIRNENRNKGYFDESRMRQLEAIAGKRLSELGYEVTNPDGNREPRAVERAWWFLSDTYHIVKRQIVLKTTVQKRLTWGLFFAKWKMILGSLRANAQFRRKD